MKLVSTRRIQDTMSINQRFQNEVMQAMDKFRRNDWGDTCADDQQLNNESLKNGDSIVALYHTSVADIFIITDAGHLVTTVLFTSEY